MVKQITLLHFKYNKNNKLKHSIGFSKVYESGMDASSLDLARTCSNQDILNAYKNFCKKNKNYSLDSAEDFDDFTDVNNNGRGSTCWKSIFSDELDLNDNSILYGYLIKNIRFKGNKYNEDEILHISTKKYKNVKELLKEYYPHDEMESDDLIMCECEIKNFKYYIPR